MSKVMKFVALTIVAGLMGGVAPTPSEAQEGEGFVVIVNQSNTVGSMPAKDVSKLFLKKRTKWPAGGKVLPVDQPEISPVRDAFSRSVLNKTPKEVENYWMSVVFSGRASSPAQKKTDSDVITYVRTHPGAIGYVSSDADISGVKKLDIR